MYRIDTGQAKDEMFGLNKGDAQIFDLSGAQAQIDANRKMKFAKAQADQKEKTGRESDIYSNIGNLDKVSIYAGHRPEFAQGQKELRDYVVSNIRKLRDGDVDATMEFQNKYTKLMTEAELSKNFREQTEAYGLQVLKDPAAYREESIDYLNNAGRNEDGTMNFVLDPSKVKKNTDLVTDFRTNVRPIIEDMAKGKSYSYTDEKGNESTVDINNFDKNHATDLLKDQLRTRPEVADQAAYEFRKLPKAEQDMYGGDFTKYYVDKMLPMAIVDQNKTVFKKAEDKEGTATIEVADPEDPMTFKAEKLSTGVKLTPTQQTIANISDADAVNLTPEQQKIRLQYKAGEMNETVDIPMAAKATHIKPILSNTPITDKMRTLSGGKVPKGVEIRDGEYGQTAVMPFVKSGKNKGDLIKKDDVKSMEQAGNVEWTVATVGTLSYGEGAKAKKVSIVRPASEIKSALSKKVPLDDLQKIADQKNAQKPKAATSKNPPEITSQKAHDALPKGAKYTFNGKVYTKK